MHTLARYRVLKHLGSGATGGVYLVEDRLQGGAPVALKQLGVGTHPAFRAGFAREFAVLSSLALPGVARVFDLGLGAIEAGEAPRPYFTRSYVEGVPLDQHLSDATTSSLVARLVDVIGVVDQLHRRGVVHADIKPANIIIDPAGCSHLIDFGLAGQAGAHETMAGSGTPGFMAPELFSGVRPDQRADVYALGATVWMLVTGWVPYEQQGETALSEKLSGRLPEIPEGLGAERRGLLECALLALAPEASERLPAAGEFAARLERVLRAPGERTTFAPGPPREFVQPRPRGREGLLDSLSDLLTQQASVVDGLPAERTALLTGPLGMGKSTLLRELKWRMQLAGVSVIELQAAQQGWDLKRQIEHQCAVMGPAAEGASTRCDEGQGPIAALRHSLESVARLGPLVVLVDDIDRADPWLSDLLREVLHADDAPHLMVLACAADGAHPGLQRIAWSRTFALAPLEQEVLTHLTQDAVGAVDAAAQEALCQHSDGNPGLLMEALAQLVQRDALTADDVRALPVGRVGAVLAQQRWARLSPTEQHLAAGLAASGGSLPWGLCQRWLGDEVAADASAGLQGAAIVTYQEETLTLSDEALRRLLLSEEGQGSVARSADELRDQPSLAEVSPRIRVELALHSGDAERIRTQLGDAVQACLDAGATGGAIRIQQAGLAYLEGAARREAHLKLADICSQAGIYERAHEEARALLDDPGASASLRARAAVTSAGALVAGSRLDEAVADLARVPPDASPALRAEAARELARVQARRGEVEAAVQQCHDALGFAPRDHPARIELLALLGLLLGRRGEHVPALERYEEALGLARELGSRADEAQVLGYMGLSAEDRGDLQQARECYTHCLTAFRSVGDVGRMATYSLNLGNVCYNQKLSREAGEHYELAIKLSHRAGRRSSAALAELAMALLERDLGLHERARNRLESTLEQSRDLGLGVCEAGSLAALGTVAVRCGDIQSGLDFFEQAGSLFERHSRVNHLAEVHLDTAEALLARGGGGDASAASGALGAARNCIEDGKLEGPRTRLQLLTCRQRLVSGDVDGAVPELDRLEQVCREQCDRDMLWQVLVCAADCQEALREQARAERHLRLAAEVLEDLASKVPEAYREAYRGTPQRRQVLRRARNLARAGSVQRADGYRATSLVSGRMPRLLEILKRLAREHDVDRLLERITDAAVDLSGAERGFVLLTDAEGNLQPRTSRDRLGASDPHVAFSQSIAESVLIDGEPLVTMDARGDQRLSEYMSVHQLMLRSVACLPINGPERAVGVLYLEHRVRSGRFHEADLEVLLAFADQVAIALENARLISENRDREAELVEANRALREAHDEVERVLRARTEELEQTRGELDRARGTREGGRYGLVGSSPAMRRVFALMERVQGSSVPVVVQGESGTGKELVARGIHEGGDRAGHPFVAVHCAAIPEALLESELFGHVRGAFTGADRDREGVFVRAHGGTLFLDEFSDVPQRMQVALLRVLQEACVRPVGAEQVQEVDVRVVVASREPLSELVAAGKLREDLYYRLSVVEVSLPALRERREDISEICEVLLRRIAREQDGAPRRLSRAGLDALMLADLPGNVRQLEHMLTSAIIMGDGGQIEPEALGLVRSRPEALGTVASDAAMATSDSGRPTMPAPGTPGEAVTVVPVAGLPVAGLPVAGLPVAGLPVAGLPADLVASVGLPVPGRSQEREAEGRGTPSTGVRDIHDHKQRERMRILQALESHGWNRAQAARELGMPRRTFYRRLKEYEIQ